MSNVVQDLCRLALQTEEIRAEYEEACRVSGEVPIKEDKRKRIARPHYKTYVDPDRTEDQEIATDLRKAQQARPIFTPEDQAKLFEMVKAGVISKEKALEMMSYQPPAPDQSKEEKQMQMRGEMLEALGEQDARLQKMEAMMSEMFQKIATT
ncbi:hypothetical protein [Synechococcus sp. BIOS-U3-1]|uniref:hypothetical protein n=1 Tax=Synechococcus sp. BIOS-U3-1 TaxID=1400865 RepID=UPI0016492FA1|nr:hypothetical protein [Synechococcus sp. BIOS-U3-1]